MFGGPQTEQFVAPALRFETQFLIEFELRFVGLFDLTKVVGHDHMYLFGRSHIQVALFGSQQQETPALNCGVVCLKRLCQ
jgi:hypothetical protein